MKRIILFRFHKNIAVCKNRLEQIKLLNPQVLLYGLYGGHPDDPEGIQEALRSYFVNIFSIADKSDDWKWKNSDLAVRLWFQKIGYTVDFDMLHLLEWDLLLCESLDKIYQHVSDGVGLTGLVSLSTVEDRWGWTNKDPWKSEWQQLLTIAKDKFSYREEPYACLGPGACFSKAFLEKYAAIEVPKLAHDELRLPLFCQILKEPMHDTGFYKKWFFPPERKYFNCINENIALVTIQQELLETQGRRVFHPFREIFDF